MSSIEKAWLAFAFVWLLNLVLALAATLISNGIFAVPLFQVVNTSLSITLFFVYAFMLIMAILAVMALFAREFIAAGALLVVIALYALLPFASIAAYLFYSWIGHLKLDDAFVYHDFIAKAGSVVSFVAGLFGASGRSDALISFFNIAAPIVGTIAAFLAIMSRLQRG